MKTQIFIVVGMAAVILAADRGIESRDRPVFGTPGRDCREACTARCDMAPCGDTSEARCIRQRMDCRVRCSSKC